MLNVATWLALAAALSTPAEQTSKGIARCAREQGDLARLACYDRLARSLGLDVQSQGTTQKGRWRISQVEDPVTDAPVLVAQLTGDTELVGRGGKTASPMLVIQCDQGDLGLYVYTGISAQRGSTEVIYRLDSEKAVAQKWDTTAGRDAVFYDPRFGVDTTTLVESLASHSTLFFQLTPNRAGPTSTTFSLQGLGDIVPRFREACPDAWTKPR